ncbi:uncharacterized protein LOC123566404 [Mercenaria mercenaria]|uniref:uncharacterized protein LOC123566404 n=1 Tax=Mercenaria mercenaria TaxID=6596 RepID=UPI00234E6574|nr:uncharacterized protein LOC123566404 [Mercenaria mercenaria]
MCVNSLLFGANVTLYTELNDNRDFQVTKNERGLKVVWLVSKMKDGKSTFTRRKSVDFDETKVRSESEKFDSAFQLLVITGQQTRNTTSSSHQGNVHPKMNSIEEVNKRPLSDRGPISKVVNLPKLHESDKSSDDSVGNRNTGTIRRPFEGNDILRPLVVQAFSKDLPEQEETSTSVKNGSASHRSQPIVDLDSEVSRSPNENMSHIESNPISTFPFVEEDEIDKHRHMNEEAEKNGSLKPPPNRYQNYLKRLKLERKTIQDKKANELKLVKKKILKRTQTRPKFAKEFKDDFNTDKPLTPPKPKETEAKPVKLILGFRYSYALEQYYRGQMRHHGSEITIQSEDISGDREEVTNGWLVKSLGPTVLNLRARTLPSCNPIELRLRRRQQMRIRDLTRSRGLNRSWSHESGLSRGLLKSRESYSKLNTIEEGRESRHSNRSSHGKKVVISQSVDVIGAGETNDQSTVTSLPPIHSPNRFIVGVSKLKKAISLRLPPVTSEE